MVEITDFHRQNNFSFGSVHSRYRALRWALQPSRRTPVWLRGWTNLWPSHRLPPRRVCVCFGMDPIKPLRWATKGGSQPRVALEVILPPWEAQELPSAFLPSDACNKFHQHRNFILCSLQAIHSLCSSLPVPVRPVYSQASRTVCWTIWPSCTRTLCSCCLAGATYCRRQCSGRTYCQRALSTGCGF